MQCWMIWCQKLRLKMKFRLYYDDQEDEDDDDQLKQLDDFIENHY